ncbi:unnamed protein product [Allacma fusca]|uniref:Uncharacterized protein n=1 Tax=Allacma fusca TaxID=39272 RepID=A0A8J2LT47_9HEXA|nr:unnamed protein product [Allacma fusca]
MIVEKSFITFCSSKFTIVVLILSVSPLLYLVCFLQPVTALDCYVCEYEEKSHVTTKECLRPQSPAVNKVTCATGQSCETTIFENKQPFRISIRRGCSNNPPNRTCDFPYPFPSYGDDIRIISCFCQSDGCNDQFPFADRRCLECTFVENINVTRSSVAEDVACSVGAKEYSNKLCPNNQIRKEPMRCLKVSGLLDVPDGYIRVIRRECTVMGIKDDADYKCFPLKNFVSAVNPYVRLRSAVGCVCNSDNCNNKAGTSLISVQNFVLRWRNKESTVCTYRAQ